MKHLVITDITIHKRLIQIPTITAMVLAADIKLPAQDHTLNVRRNHIINLIIFSIVSIN